MIRVQFLKAWRNYNGAEIAAFEQHMVDQLVTGGWAVLVDEAAGGPVEGAESVAGGPAAPDGRKKPAATLPEQGSGA